MGDRMRLIPFEQLMNWVITEKEEKGTIFGVRKFFKANPDKMLSLFNEKLETPIGPAAGPHTQLSQNIIASYVSGSRFFEVKTVQVIDGEDLPVGKPCIDARDECYNTEWSTELRVPDALDEYIKAWFALKLISKEYGLGSPDGFIFNMSVGYDFDGITTPKIDAYIEGMKEAKDTKVFKECKEYALANLDKFKNIDAQYIESISSKVCNSITLSTLHGCPPTEIEKIATYLINVKHLNTYIKCNPTLLGYDFARKTMDDMGYDYMEFDDFHFRDDLQYEDAIPMMKRLMALAADQEVAFGVKITNTFPVNNPKDVMGGDEMYMSGRALFPLSIALADRLSKEFNGNLKISYSGGADNFNIDRIFDSGVWPITMATTMLKPGGYNRIAQMADKVSAMEYKEFTGTDVEKLSVLAASSKTDNHHIKSVKPLPSRKMEDKVPLTNCFVAPCEEGCPIHQDIPSYISYIGDGNYLEALKVIVDKNPLPFITGTICNHRCMNKCTRNFYEESVQIRDAKLVAANEAYDELEAQTADKVLEGPSKVAIIGGGPAGIAAAYFLGRYGVKSTIFEKRDSLGGIVKHVIPEFRISDSSIDKDIHLMEKMGAEVKLNCEIASIEELKAQGYEFVLFANGAWKPADKILERGEEVDVLEFLEQCKKSMDTLNVGKNVAVIGGGNTAMDAARAAKRVPGVEKVTVVYRRTKKYMPADEEELVLVIEEGIEFAELVAPVALENGKLICKKMVLGDPDASGRRSPVETDEIVTVDADTVISAIGEKVDSKLFTDNGVEVKKNVFGTNENNVYAIGDALRGPATVVEAIADAQKAALTIAFASKKVVEPAMEGYNFSEEEARAKKGNLAVPADAKCESSRCLECSCVCEACVDVCPNRANTSIKTADGKTQIIHLDGLCNECGNCQTFCPYDSAPYLDKFTYFIDVDDFEDSKNQGFTVLDKTTKQIKVRLDETVFDTNLGDPQTNLPKDLENAVFAIFNDYSYLLK